MELYNLRKSWIFMNPWSKSPQEHVLHVRQEARKGRPMNRSPPCINGATSVHLSRLNASPYSLLGVEVEMQSSVYENLC